MGGNGTVTTGELHGTPVGVKLFKIKNDLTRLINFKLKHGNIIKFLQVFLDFLIIFYASLLIYFTQFSFCQ